MNVKIDTKEKFTIITPELDHLSAILSEELKSLLLGYLTKMPPHIILNLKHINTIDEKEVLKIIDTQGLFYEQNLSFVICEIKKPLIKLFEDSPNITPTESEAMDIVQMEEIEREIMNDL